MQKMHVVLFSKSCCKVETACMLHVTDVCLPCCLKLKIKINSLWAATEKKERKRGKKIVNK